MLKGAISYS